MASATGSESTPSVDSAVAGTVHSPVRAALSRAQAEDTATVLRVVSDPTRLQILSLIHTSANQRARVTELTVALGLRQPTVSHHLKVMTEAGVVAREPIGREVWYHIVPTRLDAIADLLR
jgi:ArsR family transcriptional regulator|nr:metalloregulator ArsR/SmtB family transcription factor [uncultured Rhodococcus sp.]